MKRYDFDAAALNPTDNGGECVEVAVETVEDDMRRIVFTAHSYGSSEAKISSYSYSVDGLNRVIGVLTRERDRILADKWDK